MAAATYIILFRGVGGKTQLPTKPLRESLAAAGFRNVATYINSGNAIVQSTLSKDQITGKIAAICRQDFGFEKAIFALTLPDWEKLISQNPFAESVVAAPTTVHAAVLADQPKPSDVKRIKDCAVNGEDIQVLDRVVYLHTPHGFGRSRMAEKFDPWIGVINTARNWNTVVKLAELGRTVKP